MSTILLTLLLGLGLLWLVQRRMIYFPFGQLPRPAEAGLRAAEAVTFTTTDGVTIGGWFVPSGNGPARFTVLVLNGNAGNRAARAPLAEALAERGIATLLFDYRGYGGNAGSPTEVGLALDAQAALGYLQGRSDVDTTRIVYFGESLGAAVAVGLAVEHPPFVLALRSPFTSLAEVGRHHYPFLPVRWMLRDRFPSIDRIAGVRAPLLVIAGDRDRVVPVAMSERLFAAAADPKRLVIIAGADHNDYSLFAGERLLSALVDFTAESQARRQ